jgi:hypothetical protein
VLAVPFANPDGSLTDADVFVGSTRYTTAADSMSSDSLPIDPNDRSSELLQSLNSVVLPPLEPRSYASDDTVTLTYEGSYAGDHSSGFFGTPDASANTFVLTDASLSFCGAGVYDQATLADYAVSVLGVPADAAASFALAHGDYVQLTTAFPAEDDSYWSKAGVTRSDCTAEFGPEDADSLDPRRDFMVISASAGQLLLTPRAPSTALVDDVLKCFPTVQKYRLRAGGHWVLVHSAFGFRHDVIAGADNACVRSCNPLKKWDKGRVFEISSSNDNCRPPTVVGMEAVADPLDLRVGCAGDEVACVYDQGKPGTSAAVTPSNPAFKCVFDGLNDRFALYRGRLSSVRDAIFTWQTTGGFTPLVMSLSSLSTVVAPQSIQYLQQPEQMAVVDGASQGLTLFSLDTFSVVKPSPFY